LATILDGRETSEKVMEELARLDEVAYVRFASVYRRFKDITQFMEELKTLLKKSAEASGDPAAAGSGTTGSGEDRQGKAGSDVGGSRPANSRNAGSDAASTERTNE